MQTISIPANLLRLAWCIFIPFSAISLHSQDTTTISRYYVPGNVIITGSRLPNDGKNPRNTIVVISRADIEYSPARSVEELLESVAGIDVRQRGPMGVQSDIGIRGGTFEQTLLLLDGIKMIDVQTGHHTMNIPVTLDDIERIEILKGPGSAQYGPNAFTGAINIITRKFQTRNFFVQAVGGTNGFWELGTTLGIPFSLGNVNVQNRFSVSRRKADGYATLDSNKNSATRMNTDFDIITATANMNVEVHPDLSITTTFNIVNKNFGANNFYAPRPLQYEETRTAMGALTVHWNSLLPLKLHIYSRHNRDYFIINRERPTAYLNNHSTHTHGIEIQSTFESFAGKTVLGSELALDGILSINNSASLGDRTRERLSFFAEHQWMPASNVTIALGANTLWNSEWGWNISPSGSLGWQILPALAFRANIGKSFRVPTYTDLYYKDQFTLGNAALKPETAWTYEVGLTTNVFQDLPFLLQSSLTFFQRKATELIDFIRPAGDSIWSAQNISSASINGVDLHVNALFTPGEYSVARLDKISISYSWINPSFATASGFASRYALDQLRHQVVYSMDISLLQIFTHQWRFRYEERIGFGSAGFADTRLLIRLQNIHSSILAEITNLFNTVPINGDFVGQPVTGRWIRIGFLCDIGSIFK